MVREFMEGDKAVSTDLSLHPCLSDTKVILELFMEIFMEIFIELFKGKGFMKFKTSLSEACCPIIDKKL